MKIRVLFVCLLILVAYIANAFANPIPLPLSSRSSTPQVKYGFSWSFENADWYGLNSRDAYVKLLDEVKFDWVRLSIFWDRHVKDGELNLGEIEFAIREAEKRDIKVIVVVGAKTPYHPEYHLPDNIKNQIKFGDTITVDHPIADDLLEIDRIVVQELSKYPNISYWQVENEPFLANIDNLKIGPDLLGAEVDVVRGNDLGHRPIILNHVGPAAFDRQYKKLFEIMKPGDILGVNSYLKTQGVNLFSVSVFGREIRVPWPKWLFWPVQSWVFLSPDYTRLRSEAAEKGLDLWVLEMQADPYVRSISEAQRKDYFFDTGDISRGNDYLEASGVDSIGFWGAAFWLYRERIGDSSWINTISDITSSRQ